MSRSNLSGPRSGPPAVEITPRQLTAVVVAIIVICTAAFVAGIFIGRNDPELGTLVARTDPGADDPAAPSNAAQAGAGRQMSPRLDIRETQDARPAPSSSATPPGASSSESVRYVDLREIASAGAAPAAPAAAEEPQEAAEPAETSPAAAPADAQTPPDAAPAVLQDAEPSADAPQDAAEDAETSPDAPLDAPPSAETPDDPLPATPLTPPMDEEPMDALTPPTIVAPEQPLEEPPASPPPAAGSQGTHYGVQVAAVAVGADGPQQARRKAQAYVADHPELGAVIVESGDGKWMRIVAGRYADRAAANRRKAELNAQPAYQGCFVQAIP